MEELNKTFTISFKAEVHLDGAGRTTSVKTCEIEPSNTLQASKLTPILIPVHAVLCIKIICNVDVIFVPSSSPAKDTARLHTSDPHLSFFKLCFIHVMKQVFIY